MVVEYKETGNIQEDIAQLAQAPGLEWMAEIANRDDVNWQAVQEVHDQWKETNGGVGGPGMQLLSLAMAVALSFTGVGAAAGAAIADTVGMAGNAAMTAAFSAGFNSLVIQASMQVVGNGGDIGAALEALASIDTVRALATAMPTAGLSKGIIDYVNGDEVTAATGAATEAASEAAKTAEEASFIADLAQSLQNSAIQAGVSAGVDTAINGGNLGENLLANMRSAAVSTLGATLANEIGEAYHKGDLDYVTHKIAHAALGGAMDLAMGGDGVSGAIGGAVGEITGEALAGEIKQALKDGNIDPTQVQDWMAAGVDVSKLAAGLVAAAAGQDIGTAAEAAGNAAENNAFFVAAAIILEIADKIMMAADIAEFGEAVIIGDKEKQEELILGFLIGMGIENTIGNLVPGSYVALRTALKAGKLDVVLKLLPDSAIKWMVNHADEAFSKLQKKLIDEYPDLQDALAHFDFDSLKSSDELETLVAKRMDEINVPSSGTSTDVAKIADKTENVVDSVSKVDKWSRLPKTLQDEMALKAAMRGEGTPIVQGLNDSRYKGMWKMEYKVKSKAGRDSVVHYVLDPKTGKTMDFKFKKHSDGTIIH
ncbi:DUF637 domain-containing protein [Pseudodesulfovibrio sediminis]|uniref:Toxin CdiA n=1 Tax=Pseudodesulfovibrio sediminis TaxID=2810563 RepID=A0ABM7P7E5_9BACT|nr:DUF637 domain-containing protein [Pseudodesulfovibrio sediminis]BCS88796.1 hypothetical protein PSDVSF_20380 [Pseudodesulfovibrio sediminis]